MSMIFKHDNTLYAFAEDDMFLHKPHWTFNFLNLAYPLLCKIFVRFYVFPRNVSVEILWFFDAQFSAATCSRFSSVSDLRQPAPQKLLRVTRR